MSKDVGIRCNNEIIAKEIRVINENGDMLGVMTVPAALRHARDVGLDLVEVSPNASPPVCKIMNYGKFKYELQKKAQAAKKNQKTVEIKEIKLRPNIAEGDLKIKLRKAHEFLKDGDKVRFSLYFKGREITHEGVGAAIMNRCKQEFVEIAKIEVEPKMEGKQIFMVVAPK